MRTWIFNRIRGLSSIPARFGSPLRVISSGAGDNPEEPFMIVTMGVEGAVLGMPKSARVQNVPFTVWVHDKPGSMLNIDEASIALKNDLPTAGVRVGNGSIFDIDWVETGEDSYDDHYKTNCRPVRFNMVTKR